MAKYVGRIFQVSNRTLNIKGQGTHFVNVTWYNPKTKTFRCKIITSLETEQKLVTTEQKKNLHLRAHLKKGYDTYYFLDKNAYHKLRNGEVQPIPIQKMQGFNLWGGYSSTIELKKSQLNIKKLQNKKILK